MMILLSLLLLLLMYSDYLIDKFRNCTAEATETLDGLLYIAQ